MLTLLRVIVLEWILARFALRWVLLIGILAIGGLVLAIGVPTLLILGASLVGWRWYARRSAVSP